jgi:hypothetical protein
VRNEKPESEMVRVFCLTTTTLKTMSHHMENSVKSFSLDGTKKNPMNTIFPILSIDDFGKYGLIGTGFFIGEDGLFATAKHVLISTNQGAPLHNLVAIQFIGDAEGFLIREIEIIAPHPEADVAVGRLKTTVSIKTNQPLLNHYSAISRHKPTIGENVFTYCYPKTTVLFEDIQKIKVETNEYHGKVENIFPNGRDRVMLPSACYQIKMGIIGGASGGPVFNEQGLVVAINSTSYEEDDITFVSCIADIFEINTYFLNQKEMKMPPNLIKEKVYVL